MPRLTFPMLIASLSGFPGATPRAGVQGWRPPLPRAAQATNMALLRRFANRSLVGPFEALGRDIPGQLIQHATARGCS